MVFASDAVTGPLADSAAPGGGAIATSSVAAQAAMESVRRLNFMMIPLPAAQRAPRFAPVPDGQAHKVDPARHRAAVVVLTVPGQVVDSRAQRAVNQGSNQPAGHVVDHEAHRRGLSDA